MILSVENYTIMDLFGDKKSIKMIKDAGFDAFDYSFYYSKGKAYDMLGDDYIKKATEMRKYIDEIGFVCNQAHSPFDFRHFDEIDMSNENYVRMVRSIECAKILGAKNLIMHPVGRLPKEYNYLEYNREYLKSYIPFCEKHEMHVSVENMCMYNDEDKLVGIKGFTTAKEHMDFVKSLGSRWFNICVDTGHYAVVGIKPEDAIREMNADILKSLHIHDNNYILDQHLLPYGAEFDWNEITAALGEIEYDGDFTLELIGFFRKLPPELMCQGLKFAEQTGRALIDKIKG